MCSSSEKGGEEMSGLTVGPRQFTLQKDICAVKMASPHTSGDSIEFGGSDWEFAPSPKFLWNQTKLDLRPYYQANNTKALDLLNITLQESPVWSTGSSDIGVAVWDILTTVRLNRQTITDVVLSLRTPGFLITVPPGTGITEPLIQTQILNPSQVVWGLWRYLDHDINLDRLLVLRASSYFGEGEIVVSPALYWTRIVTMYSPSEGSSMLIPAANLVVHAAAVDITEGQELAQMSRMAQR